MGLRILQYNSVCRFDQNKGKHWILILIFLHNLLYQHSQYNCIELCEVKYILTGLLRHLKIGNKHET